MVRERCEKCKRFKASVEIHSSDLLLCKQCADYNDACLRNNVMAQWDVVEAGHYPALPDSSVRHSVDNNEIISNSFSGSDAVTDNDNHNNVRKERDSDISIFDQLSSATDTDSFVGIFYDRIKYVYEYDKREITEFLQGLQGGIQPTKDKLLSLRLQLYERLGALFPTIQDSEMYNR